VQKIVDQLDRSAVGPVQVIEREHERPGPNELGERGADCREEPVPLHRQQRAPALTLCAVDRPRERREDCGQLGELGLGQHLPQPPGEGPQHRVEGLRDRPVRDVPLQFARPAAGDPAAAPLGDPDQLVEQPGLADAGLAQHDDGRRPAGPDGGERPVERPQLGRPPDEGSVGCPVHAGVHAPYGAGGSTLSGTGQSLDPGCHGSP
jgi:hypothetical protein